MRILASGSSTTFSITVKRDRGSDPSAAAVLSKITDAVRGAMSTEGGPGGAYGNEEATSSWYVPKVKGEVLASRLNLVSTKRAVSYSSLLDAISAASRA